MIKVGHIVTILLDMILQVACFSLFLPNFNGFVDGNHVKSCKRCNCHGPERPEHETRDL